MVQINYYFKYSLLILCSFTHMQTLYKMDHTVHATLITAIYN